MIRRGPGLGAPPVHGSHGPLPPPLASQVSSVTNSNDFLSKDSRVFIGNLNTFVLAKEDVDGIFGRYGIVRGISMHKGYAFVQFGHPGEARRAVSFEQGRMYAGQPFDLNIVSEPKHKPPQKRSVSHPIPGNDSYDRQPPMRTSPMVPPPLKRPRQDSNPSMQRGNLVTLSSSSKGPTQIMSRPRLTPRPTVTSSASKAAAAVVKRASATVTRSTNNAALSSSSSAVSVASTTDVLICGVCKMSFTSLHSLAQHKKIPCRLRMSCQCQTNPPKQQEDRESMQLDCATCDARFDSAWALCQHCQTEHSMSIFKTKAGSQGGSEDKNSKVKTEGGTKPADKKTTTPSKKE